MTSSIVGPSSSSRSRTSAALVLAVSFILAGCGGKKDDKGGGGGGAPGKQVGCGTASGTFLVYASPVPVEGAVAQVAADVCTSRQWSPTLRQCLKDAKAKAAVTACFTDPAELTALLDALTKANPPAPPAPAPTPPAAAPTPSAPAATP